jgi:uncharacterized protein
MSDIKVANTYLYPIKSCGGMSVDQVTFSEFGIAHDREMMLVDDENTFLSQRQHAELALAQTNLESDQLVVNAPHMGKLAIPLEQDPDAEEFPISIWEKPGSGTIVSPEADEYFSDYLRMSGTRLLRVRQPREIKPECRQDGYSSRTAFADGFPLLVTSTGSLDELNRHLDQRIPMNRFRPNIVVEGAPAYDEDYWRKVQLGDLQAFVVRACARCPIPNIDQAGGELPRKRPVTKALRATRRGIDPFNNTQEVFFGQNLVHVPEPGVVLRVGDPVSVVTRADEPNWLPLESARR